MIQFGNDKIKDIYVGSDKIKEVYHGSDLVWSGTEPFVESYVTQTSVSPNTQTIHPDTTPFSNFCTSGNELSSVTFNISNSVQKRRFTHLVFGTDYNYINQIPDYFGYQFVSASIDISGMKEIESIGGNCQFLGNYFKIGSISPPLVGSNFIVGWNTIIYVPMSSVSAYKSAPGWSNHSDKIQGY